MIRSWERREGGGLISVGNVLQEMNYDGGEKCNSGLRWHGLYSTRPRRVTNKRRRRGGWLMVQWSKHGSDSWMEAHALMTRQFGRSWLYHRCQQ